MQASYRVDTFSIHYQALSSISYNIESDGSCECASKGVNVFGRCIRLPGRSEMSLASTTPCRLQLCVVSGSIDSKYSDM
jgi:hypothetical protein